MPVGFLYWSFRRPGLCGFLCCSPTPDQPPGGGVGLSVTVIAPLQASWLLEQSFASAGYGLSGRHERGGAVAVRTKYPARPGRRVIVVTDLASLGGPSRGVEVAVRDRLAAVVIGRRELSAWRLWPPGGGVVGLRVLPGGARDISSHYVGSAPVQAAAGSVIPDRGPRISMRGSFLDIAQRHSRIECGGAAARGVGSVLQDRDQLPARLPAPAAPQTSAASSYVCLVDDAAESFVVGVVVAPDDVPADYAGLLLVAGMVGAVQREVPQRRELRLYAV